MNSSSPHASTLARVRGPERLAGEDDAPVAREGLGDVDAELRGRVLDHQDERAGQRVPAGRSQFPAEAEQQGHVGGLVVDEHRRGADAAHGVVDRGPAEREQAVHEVVARPAAELPELADEEARASPRVGRRRRVAGRARRREDRAEDLAHLRVVEVDAEQAAVRVVVTVTEGPDGVLVDERHLLVEVVHRGDVGGRHPGGVPGLADQRRALVRPGDDVAEQHLLGVAVDLLAGHRLDRGDETAPSFVETRHRRAGPWHDGHASGIGHSPSWDGLATTRRPGQKYLGFLSSVPSSVTNFDRRGGWG